MQTMSPALRRAVQTARQKRFPKGQIILYPGDEITEVLVLKSGVVKMHDIDDQGHEKILHIVAPPAVVPFAFFTGGDLTVQWFYSCLVDCEVYSLPQKAFLEQATADGELAMALMSGFTYDVHELLVRLSSLGKSKARDKLLATFKFLQVCHGEERPNDWWRVAFPISHQLLADITGMTRESATATLKELQSEGVIRFPRLNMLEIHRPQLLQS